MPGIISRLTRSRKPLSLAEKHSLMLEALQFLRAEMSPDEIQSAIEGMGASADEARALVAQGQAKFDAELVRSVALPASAHYEINYYFLLGVTPMATTERIHRAYRRKAKGVHPDLHDSEFTREYWSNLMALISDAQQVLSDPLQRRAYDVVWRERSKKVAAQNRRRGELRGDWETRYRWDMAELSEIEDEMSDLLEDIRERINQGQGATDLGGRLLTIIDNYEGEILDIRTSTHGLPPPFLHFGDTVRHEMQRKERLVAGLQQLGGWLADPSRPMAGDVLLDHVATAEHIIEDVRIAMHQFDIAALR